MSRDPIVEEIQRTRQKIMAECGGDLDRLLDYMKACEKQDRSRVVSATSSSRMIVRFEDNDESLRESAEDFS